MASGFRRSPLIRFRTIRIRAAWRPGGRAHLEPRPARGRPVCLSPVPTGRPAPLFCN